MTEKHPNLAAALSAFQGEMPTVAKTKRANVGQYAYSYADLADVTEAATPTLAKHGLAFAGSARHVDGGRYEVVGILSHESGESREGALPISGSNPQQIGSAITYMRRYLYGVMTGIVTDDDDDGRVAQGATKRAAKKAAAAPPPSDDRNQAELMQPKTRGRLFALFGDLKIPEEQQLPGINQILGTDLTSRGDLSEAQARAVIKRLEEKQRQGAPA